MGVIFCNGVMYNGAKGDPGNGISEIRQNYNGTISIFLDDGSEHIVTLPESYLPTVTHEDAGKFLRVNAAGVWETIGITNGNEVAY